MSHHPNRTTNAAIAERQNAVQEKIRELQRANPSWSYDQAYAECKKQPEMLSTFVAMQNPAEIPDPAKVQELSVAQRKAAAEFRGKVEAAAHQRGISFDQAWQSMKAEEPDLHAAMVGDNDPEKRLKEQMGWRN